MSAPNQRPTLQGQRIKTRKRGEYLFGKIEIFFKLHIKKPQISDEKEKYDPSAFRDAILQGFKETEGNLEQVCLV